MAENWNHFNDQLKHAEDLVTTAMTIINELKRQANHLDDDNQSHASFDRKRSMSESTSDGSHSKRFCPAAQPSFSTTSQFVNFCFHNLPIQLVNEVFCSIGSHNHISSSILGVKFASLAPTANHLSSQLQQQRSI